MGFVLRAEQSESVRGLATDKNALSARDVALDLKASSFDGILDPIGVPASGSYLRARKLGGVLSLVGAVSANNVSFDHWDLTRPVTLKGYSSESLHCPALRGAVAALVR